MESSIPYPPGFTPEKVNVTFEQEAQEVQGEECIRSHHNLDRCSSRVFEKVEKSDINIQSDGRVTRDIRKEGGSILDILDEIIKVGQTMGFTMDGCTKDMEKIIGSNGGHEFDHVVELKSRVLMVAIFMCFGTPMFFTNAPIIISDICLLYMWNGECMADGRFQRSGLNEVQIKEGYSFTWVSSFQASNTHIRNQRPIFTPGDAQLILELRRYRFIPFLASLFLFLIKCYVHVELFYLVDSKVISSEFQFHRGMKRDTQWLLFCSLRIMESLHLSFNRAVESGLFPRLFALDTEKDISVAGKLQSPLVSSFRRNVRGCIEEQQLEHLVALLDSVILSNSNDRWVSDLNGRRGSFVLKTVWNLLDEFFFLGRNIPMRLV
ncbi:hypothetical protein Tco_0121772 [Tanacetum coccineum]